jgi:hypothetical protein
MKALPSILIFAGLACTAFADAPAIPLSTRNLLSEGLQNQFKFTLEPILSSASGLPMSTDEPVVRMEPFIVTAYIENRALTAIFQQQERAFKEKRLSLKDGGVFLRKGKVFTSELRLKFGPIRHGIELFRVSISW